MPYSGYRVFLLSCCAWLFLCGQPAYAQKHGKLALTGADTLLPHVVLVLRLVSSTHVEPTTGVVISATGQVLIPSDFASPDDEIIVLDGGTDIIRNGRPAKIERRFFSEGLTVISVPGLKRAPARLSTTAQEDGGSVHLAAFPPAEMIAEGAAPLSIPATVIIFGESGRPGISGETALPNVTGPLLDECGNLAGMSSADGVQSMSTTQVPRYQWADGIKRVSSQVGISLVESPCVPETPSEEEVAEEAAAAPIAEEPVSEEPVIEEPAAEESATEEPAAEQPAGDDLLEEIETLPPHETGAPQGQDESPPAGAGAASPAWFGWLWLPGSAVLFGLAWFIHRRRKLVTESAQPAAGEGITDGPETQFLAEGRTGDTDPGLDSVLLIEGMSANGKAFRHSCRVSSLAVNVMIGRVNSDINIDSPAISRHHATLNGPRDALTISDLGSSNGTSINGVPCFEGEIMYVEPGDTIILGDVRFSCEVISPAEAAEREKG